MKNLQRRCCACILKLLLLCLLAGCAPQFAEVGVGIQKRCVDCHPEKKKEYVLKASIHKPIDEDRCEDCHYTHGLIPGPLVKKRGKELCYPCHQRDKIESGKYVHTIIEEGDRNCLPCHPAHSSDVKGLLTKDEKDLCFDCHKKEPFLARYRHKPLEKGCGDCHDSHSAQNPYLLKSSLPTLCMGCHDPSKDPKLLSSHEGMLQAERCDECHAPHSSTKIALLRDKPHPHLSDCMSCHKGLTEGFSPAKKTALIKDMCYSCHEKEKIAFAKGYQHGKGETDKCLSCHAPHASDYAGILRGKEARVCTTCHETLKKKEGLYPHSPVAKEECSGCHSPHSAPYRKMLRASKNGLCYICHKKEDFSKGYVHKPIAEGDCYSCHDPHFARTSNTLKAKERDVCARCHPREIKVFSKPESHRPVREGLCSKCHSSHFSKFTKTLLKQPKETICFSCHGDLLKKLKDERYAHPLFAKRECESCHDPHLGETTGLLLKPTTSELCLSCHRDLIKAVAKGHTVNYNDSASVHKPLIEGKCTDCHSPHSSNVVYSLQRPINNLCLSCHKDIEESSSAKGIILHKPMLENSCIKCHKGHKSPFAFLLTSKEPELCLTCHNITEEEKRMFKKNHLWREARKMFCSGCHDPHVGRDKRFLHAFSHEPFARGECEKCHPEKLELKIKGVNKRR